MILYNGHVWRADDGYILHTRKSCGCEVPTYMLGEVNELWAATNMWRHQPYADLTLEEFLVKMGFGRSWRGIDI